MPEISRLSAVHAAHLLQANNVGVQLLHCVAKVVNFQAPRRPQALHTFVDVVGGHTQHRVFVAFGFHVGMGEAKRGSIKMASAFDGEKH